jgi:hypothetical protein
MIVLKFFLRIGLLRSEEKYVPVGATLLWVIKGRSKGRRVKSGKLCSFFKYNNNNSNNN